MRRGRFANETACRGTGCIAAMRIVGGMVMRWNHVGIWALLVPTLLVSLTIPVRGQGLAALPPTGQPLGSGFLPPQIPTGTSNAPMPPAPIAAPINAPIMAPNPMLNPMSNPMGNLTPLVMPVDMNIPIAVSTPTPVSTSMKPPRTLPSTLTQSANPTPIRQANSIDPLPLPVPTTAQTMGQPTRQIPGLLIETIAPDSIAFGQPMVYEILVRNTATTALQQVRILDELPEGASHLGSDPVAEVVGTRMQWTIPVIEAGAEKRIRVEVKPSKEGEFTTRTTVTTSVSTGTRSRITRPKLTVALTAAPSSAMGEMIPFAITMTNAGTGPANKIHLKAQLSDGLSHPQGQVIEADMASIAVGETKTVTLKTNAVKSGMQACDLAISFEGGAEIVQHAEVNILEPMLKVRQTGPTKALVHQDMTFILEAANPGTASTGPLVVTIDLPEGVKYTSATESGTFDATKRQIRWEMSPLTANAARPISFKVKAMTAGDMVMRMTANAGPKLDVLQETAIKVEGIPALSFEVVDSRRGSPGECRCHL